MPDARDKLKDSIRKLASTYGIEVVGFMKLEQECTIPEDEKELLKGVKYTQGEIDFKNIKNPRDIMPGARTMIILGKRLLDDKHDISYTLSEHYTASVEFMALDIASLKIDSILKTQGYMSDEYTSYYLKVWAVYAGLGWIGKSRMFVSKVYGPRLRLKGILTDAELGDPWELLDDAMCGDCQQCIRACPVGAITDDGVDRRKCGQCPLNHRKISENAYSYCTACTMSCPVGKAVKPPVPPQPIDGVHSRRLSVK